jgi:hypothetical protein
MKNSAFFHTLLYIQLYRIQNPADSVTVTPGSIVFQALSFHTFNVLFL